MTCMSSTSWRHWVCATSMLLLLQHGVADAAAASCCCCRAAAAVCCCSMLLLHHAFAATACCRSMLLLPHAAVAAACCCSVLFFFFFLSLLGQSLDPFGPGTTPLSCFLLRTGTKPECRWCRQPPGTLPPPVNSGSRAPRNWRHHLLTEEWIA